MSSASTGASVSASSIPQSSGSGNGGGGGGGGSGGGSSGGGNSSVKVAVLFWPVAKTFLGGYLPVLLAKLYQMAWTATHNNAADTESFNRLTRHNGAASTALFGPISWFTVVPYAASWLIVPFAAEIISFDTNYGCPNPDMSNPSNPCWPPLMTINPWVSRLIQGFLSFLALTILVLVVLWFRKPHGVNNEPTSIAAVTAIAGHPQVTRDFSCPPEATIKDLKKSLKDKRYKLDYFETTNRSRRYGLVPADLGDGEIRDLPIDAPSVSSRFTFGRGWKEISAYADAIFLCYLSVLLSLTAVYLQDVNNSSLARFFASRTFGSRLFFAILGAVVCMNLGRIERGKLSDHPLSVTPPSYLLTPDQKPKR